MKFWFGSLCPCWGPVHYWSPASQCVESHGMGERVERERKGTSSGWTEGPEVRRREPVKARKWEQGMKFRLYGKERRRLWV